MKIVKYSILNENYKNNVIKKMYQLVNCKEF